MRWRTAKRGCPRLRAEGTVQQEEEAAKTGWTRRRFLKFAASATLAAPGCATLSARGGRKAGSPRLFFVSDGKTWLVNADGTGLRALDLDVPGQATWQPSGFFSDGRRVLMLSMEPRRDGPGRPFDLYYTQTPTHIWAYDIETGSLAEICAKERLAVFYTPALLLSDERILVQVVRGKAGQIYSMNIDGSDAREFTQVDEGLPYGLSASADGKRVAFHLASPRGYEVWTSDTMGGDRKLVAGHRDHLYFGTSWSPDGAWVLYQDCHDQQDPGHDWSDVCIGRPDGSEHRVLTKGQAMWFGATYGSPAQRGGGSNAPAWTRDGAILYPRRLPGSKVAWEFQLQRPDVDHFNRDYKPELARGGTEIVRLDPRTGTETVLTRGGAAVWDFRAVESPEGKKIVFCRAETGALPSLWVMDSSGLNARLFSRGFHGRGADHPRWLPLASKGAQEA